MSVPRPTRKYNATQAELYSVCSIGWSSYLENQTDFEAFNTLYTVAFGTDALAAVEAAKNLPDFQARNQETETAYVLMGQTASLCLTEWRALRSYIKKSFPPELHKPNIEAAGEDHYSIAVNRNWGETELMLASATGFIADNTAQLTAGGMPADFPTRLADLRTAFIGHYATFTDSGQDEYEGTDEKILANNDIYDSLQSMFEDAQIIYEDNAAKHDRFVFARIKELIAGSSAATTAPVPPDVIEIGVYIFDSATLEPIEGAILRVMNPPVGGPVEAFTDAGGTVTLKVADYAPDTPATVNFEVSATGYVTEPASLELTPGQLYSIDVPLNEVVVP